MQGRNGRNGQNRRTKTQTTRGGRITENRRINKSRIPRANTRVVVTVLVSLTVLLAGCAGGGGFGGSGGGVTTVAPSADSDSGGNSGTTTAGASSNTDGAGNSGTGSGTGSADTSGDSNAGSSGSLNAEDDWFNLSKPGRYVFEIETADGGTGRMSFETTKVSDGQATVHTTYDFNGSSFESTVTGPIGQVEPQLVGSPAYRYLIAIQLGGVGSSALSGGEDLKVGNKFSRQSSDGSLNIEVTKTDNYAGVDCYVIETRMNGTLNQKVCTQKGFSSVPYFATYDENGALVERVELVEYERN